MRHPEDVRFLLDLRGLGRERGQRLVRTTSVKAIASARKFDAHGDWHYFGLLWRYALWLLLGRGSFEEVARRYWYGG